MDIELDLNYLEPSNLQIRISNSIYNSESDLDCLPKHVSLDLSYHEITTD